jgi:hypothetical protein
MLDPGQLPGMWKFEHPWQIKTGEAGRRVHVEDNPRLWIWLRNYALENIKSHENWNEMGRTLKNRMTGMVFPGSGKECGQDAAVFSPAQITDLILG